jgi:hypothetical protein
MKLPTPTRVLDAAQCGMIFSFYRTKGKSQLTGQRASRTHVEDEVLVGVLEGEPAAELDAPDQHHDRRDDGQRVRHVRERRRPNAQPHGLRWSPCPPSLSLSSARAAAAADDDGMSGEKARAWWSPGPRTAAPVL